MIDHTEQINKYKALLLWYVVEPAKTALFERGSQRLFEQNITEMSG